MYNLIGRDYRKHKYISANTNADSDIKDDFHGINVYEQT